MMYLQRVTTATSRPSLRKRLCAMTLGLCAFAATPSAQATSEAPKAAPSSAPAKAKVDKKAIGQAALDTFQRKHQAVEALVEKKAKDSALFSQIDSLLNYHALAKSALGSGYPGVCKTRCAEFEKALTDLIRGNYLRFVRKAKNGRVEYLGTQVGRKGSAVKLKTKVHRVKAKAGSRTNEVAVSYVLQRKGGEDWKVVDIITEGVSLRKTYRYEFQKILERPGAQGGIDGVIAKIKLKLAELKNKP